MKLLKLCCLILLVAIGLGARPSGAHPMGNFSINHSARFEAKSKQLTMRYLLDFAEIPTADRMAKLDTNGDNQVNAREKSAYLKTEAPRFLKGLTLRLNSKKVALAARNSNLEVRPGAAGLSTLRVWMNCLVPLSPKGKTRVEYRDANFEGRTGWMEIVAVAGKGRAIRDSNASSVDLTRGLTVFPTDAGMVPPRQTSASFSVVAAGANEIASPQIQDKPNAPVSASNDQTPQNRFTQSIAERNLTPSLILWGILFAFAFGAVHALSPGHGKTMVAAYLVGTRGTPKHAVLLGLVVTITHTAGVFALGLALLFASRYILPEKLFPALSALSGMLIFGVGLWLFMSRWQGLTAGQAHSHSHDGHSHSHDHDEHTHDHDHGDHLHSHDDVEHSHSHDEDHTHSHDEDHTHSHGAHVHSHGGRAHSHAVPEGPITMKTLVALGISGGIVPCPEALVVLLAAIKLHRIGYGMVLITAFSIGLAAALIAIGMLVVSARQRLSRLDRFGEGSALVRFLPIGSAAIITLIGAVLTLRAAMGTM